MDEQFFKKLHTKKIKLEIDLPLRNPSLFEDRNIGAFDISKSFYKLQRSIKIIRNLQKIRLTFIANGYILVINADVA